MNTSVAGTIKPFWGDFVNLIFPDECQACNSVLVSGESIICTTCKYDLPYTNYHFEKDNVVEKVFWGRVPIENATSYLLFTKGGKVQNLLHQLKYRNRQDVGMQLGMELGQALIKSGRIIPDFVIPIPLHKKREHSRGYNQSAAFAMGIGSQMGVPINDNVIIRNRHTESQTKKNRHERWENVAGIFTIKNPEALNDKHVLLVDDVLTTGATIESCASSIINSSNCKISVATIAYAEF